MNDFLLNIVIVWGSVIYGGCAIYWPLSISLKKEWTPRKRLLGYLATPFGPILHISKAIVISIKWVGRKCKELWNTILYNDPHIPLELKQRRKEEKRKQREIIKKLKE